MLHLAMKAFYPAKPPFPLLHVDTTWKFREMIAFRDLRAAKLGLELIVHVNEEGLRAGNQSDHARLGGAHRRDEDRGAQAGAGQVRIRRGVRRRPPRRGKMPRQGAHLLLPHGAVIAGIRRTSGRSCGTFTTAASTRARASACSRFRTGPSSTSGNTSQLENIPIVPLYFAKERPVVDARRRADHGRRRAPAALCLASGRSMQTVRFRTLGCYPLTGAIESRAARCRDHSGDALDADIANARAASSTTTRPRRWRRKSRKDISDAMRRRCVCIDLPEHRCRKHRACRAAPRRTGSCCGFSPAARSTTANPR